jgi:hypothetical protein
LVWRNRKKISQIINAYLYLPFFLLIILWSKPIEAKCTKEILLLFIFCEIGRNFCEGLMNENWLIPSDFFASQSASK